MEDLADRGSLTPIQSMDMEFEKDKGKRPISNSQAEKSGEGTSRTVKESLTKEGNKRSRQCIPKSMYTPMFFTWLKP